MQQSHSLIHTKFRIPTTRPSLVSRSRLHEQVVRGLRGPLTLVIAPAGFGKTTLVASCASGCGMRVAWLSLDKDDNEDSRFLHYVMAAVQEANSTIGSGATEILAAREAPPEAVLTSFINDIDCAREEIVLVLDDYQFINSQAVHEQVTFLLERCPETLHLVIVSRSDPPLPVARLRANGQMVELRAADLSFTESEADRFLNDSMDLHLDSRSVAVLAERTEGWIVGLQMAALSMRHRDDVDGFIKGFSGTNRYILDYLLEEVLANQPQQIQRFLLCTSILERLSAPLCDAVVANNESVNVNGEDDDRKVDSDPRVAGQSNLILEYLERSNLFLVPLDDERQWYRYHHLFADLLRTQLPKLLPSQQIAQLHVRAADWHGQYGSLLEAIHHASMASDEQRVERFIEQHYMELVRRGEQSWLRSWTGKLSKELVLRRPWLCIYEAYSHSWFGELDEADRFMEAAEKCIRSDGALADASSMLGHLTYVKSRVTAMRGDLRQAIKLNLAAREHLTHTTLALQLDLDITLGYLYFLNGDYPHANQFLSEVIRSGRAVGAILNPVAAACLMARSYTNRGLLHQSYEQYLQAAQWIEETGGQHRGASSLIEIGIADVLCEWNDLDAARMHLERALSSLHLWGKADDLVLAYIVMARVHLAQSSIPSAEEAINQATQIFRKSGVFTEAPDTLDLAQVKFWLSQGAMQEANRWAESLQQRWGAEDPFRFENELAHIAQARIWLAQNKLEEAIGLLTQLEEIARSAGRMGRVIEILLLKALALQRLGDSEQSISALTACLILAQPEGYARIFLDEGEPMYFLLARWQTHADKGQLREYVTHLISQFDVKACDGVGPVKKVSSIVDLVEPLTPREIEVLRLVAAGLSNREIAAKLILAEGTVKFYMHAIMQKLGVHSRTQALVIAKEQNLV